MSFYEIYKEYKEFDFKSYMVQVTPEDVSRAIQKDSLDYRDLLALLSPAAESFLEEMAQKAHRLTLQHFGRSVLLYTPLYIANHCVNRCLYCSFSIDSSITRRRLTMEEIEAEAKYISEQGIRHILLLTGESRKDSPVEYIKEAVTLLCQYFDSIALEIYPLSTEDYKELIGCGADALTLYQEVYDEQIYTKVHAAGPKKNFAYRLDAPERACQAGMRSINIGALLGLADWRSEAFFTALHAKYLTDKYTWVEAALSLPRIRPYGGSYSDLMPVSDKGLVQILLALRLFLPHLGITISTRESSELRNRLIPLGVTKMSAGVSTEVGGHTQESTGSSQFDISDERSVQEISQTIASLGYQPVFKDWVRV